NNGVENIPNSVDTPFCIISELVINPAAGHNNSVQLLNDPKERACLNKLWIHNPGAYDPDGDYLTYELVTCLGLECNPVPGYTFPDVNTADPDDTFTIDPQSGDVIWDAPPLVGEFNVAIKITEWRLVDGSYVKVGSVTRDMQITVEICDNNPPEIEDLADTCIVVDDVLQFSVDATDPDGYAVFLSSFGGPYQVSNFATFNTLSGNFTWQPECEEIRAEPYFVHFTAVDNDPVQLTDIETVAIRVVAPRVENPFAEPIGNNIQVTWDAHECIDAFSAASWGQYSYKIYRRQGSFGFEPNYCETGVPEYTGFELVGTVEGLDNTTFIDDNNLGFGGLYCYMIVTCWPDGGESKASEEVCTELVKDAPVITNVSVNETDQTNGANYIAWSPPTELDSTNWTGPYQYKLIWENTGQTIYESALSDFVIWGDT
ncbi:MAG: hypothetical protein HKN32_00045, partial [Flavobacteriales bacterium]|nr:hypothetical protein [Flavobacteriales bacterium]